MPTATAPPAASPGGGAPPVPFLAGSWEYSEPMAVDTQTLDSNSHDFLHNITPGGYLRGVLFSITSANGVLGTTATLLGDTPFSIISSMTLESIDGTPILYPQNGYNYWLVSRYCRQWDGDPVNDPTYSNTINPAFRLRFFVESRMTCGVLPNTDARAQYRLRYTLAALTSGLVSSSTGVTAPAVTVNIALETYAQPPATDYAGNAIAQVPDGITLQRFVSHQSGDPLNTGNSTTKENRVGNLIRTIILQVRNSSGVRTDLTADPMRWRIDNTQLISEQRDHRDYEIDRFSKQGNASTYNSNRPTGVYVYFRYHNPGPMDGNYWLATTEATYLQFELNGGPSSGTLDCITEDLAPAGPVPAYLQGI